MYDKPQLGENQLAGRIEVIVFTKSAGKFLFFLAAQNRDLPDGVYISIETAYRTDRH
jgi:hypothetical protein